MNLNEIVEITISKALEYVVEADHESFFEEIVDAVVMSGMDREDLFGLNKHLDTYLKVSDDEDADESDYGAGHY